MPRAAPVVSPRAAPLAALLVALLAGGALPAAAQAPTQVPPAQAPAPAPAPAPVRPAAPTAPAPSPAVPVTEEGRAAARDLMEASGVNAMGDGIMLQTVRQVAFALAQSSGKPPQEVLGVVEEVLLPEFRARQPEMMADMAEAWAAALTPEELRQLAAFYRSEIGRRMVAVTPVVMANLTQLGLRWGQAVAQAAIAKHREALRGRGLTL